MTDPASALSAAENAKQQRDAQDAAGCLVFVGLGAGLVTAFVIQVIDGSFSLVGAVVAVGRLFYDSLCRSCEGVPSGDIGPAFVAALAALFLGVLVSFVLSEIFSRAGTTFNRRALSEAGVRISSLAALIVPFVSVVSFLVIPPARIFSVLVFIGLGGLFGFVIAVGLASVIVDWARSRWRPGHSG